MHTFEEGIDQAIDLKLKDRIKHHRRMFSRIFRARYLELLPSLIHYQNQNQVSIDFLKVEVALRSGYDVVIGETLNPYGDNKIQVIGYATSSLTKSNPTDLFSVRQLRSGDIKFTIPMRYRMPLYKEITDLDGCRTGNFVVLRNKVLNYTSDHHIIDHYLMELTEIVTSRFSISMQVKMSTIFRGDIGDETVNDIVESLYAGDPYIKTSKLFDPDDQIITIENAHLASNFQELKREYQNKVSELNNMIGIQSLAVEKASGVSDEEAKSNRGSTTSNANIYLDARNNPLRCLNKRYGLELQAMYNDQVNSEFQKLELKEDGGEENGPDGNAS